MAASLIDLSEQHHHQVGITEGPDRAQTGDSRRWSRIMILGCVLIGLQLIGFIWFSTYAYSHFDESQDFGVYAQAWTQIAHGHFDPYGSLLRAGFWRNNGEFILWPLASLYWLFPHPVALVWLQDLCVAATEILTFDWICKMLRHSPLGHRRAYGLALLAAFVLAVDPWAWNTIAFDFHAHTISTLLVVLAGRDLWSGRHRRPFLWVALALLCGGPSALYVIGVGLAGAVASQKVRRTSLMITGMGIGWFLFLTQIGGDGVGGAGLSSWYGYLAGPHSGHVTIGSIASGALSHPDRLLHTLQDRWMTAFIFVAAVGSVGIFSPWGFFMAAVVFMPTLFNSNPLFLRIPAAFQSWAAIPFVLVGSISVLAWLLSRGRALERGAVTLLASWVASGTAITIPVLQKLPDAWLTVTPSASAELAHVQDVIPRRAEVIAVDEVVGRFANWPSLYKIGAQWDYSAAIPVNRPVVVFIITVQHRDGGAAMRNLRLVEIATVRRLGASELVERNGVYAFKWLVPTGVTSVTLP